MGNSIRLGGFLGKFTVLKGALRELWIVFGVKLIAIMAYGVMNSTLVLWLSSDLGYNDADAGYLVAVWSTLMTLFTVLVGSLTDAIGLRRAFLLGVCVCFFSRAVMTVSVAKGVVLPAGMLPLAFGEALMGPVMVAAIRRYTTTSQRSIAFSIFYAMMNAGFFVANYVFDWVRESLGEYGSYSVPLIDAELSTYRTLFLISTLFTIPNFILLYFFLRPGIEATDEGVKVTPETRRQMGSGASAAFQMVRDTMRDTAAIFAGLWRQPGFYKFLGFLSLAAFVRLIFFHMYYTYPKFGIRELGEGAPIGRLWAINSIIIVILVPIVGALSQKVSAYRMVVAGSIVAAGSVFIMAMPPHFFSPLASGLLGELIGHRWLGLQGEVNPYYVMIFLFVVLLSIGEALYSPRLYEYAAAIAPKGQEASYMALSYLPFFVAKLLVGMFSGVLLTKYCPPEGPRDSQTLWLIIALITAIAPVGLMLFRRFIQVREAGR